MSVAQFLAAACLVIAVVYLVVRIRRFYRDVDFIANLGSQHFPDDLTIVHGNFWTQKIQAGRVAS